MPREERLLLEPAEPQIPRPGTLSAGSALGRTGRCGPQQLSDQLDRLDSILDGLADALNESVREASRTGVREAVKEAVVELLTSADLRTALHQASALEVEPKPSRWNRLKEKIRHTAERVKAGLARSAAVVAARVVDAVSAVGRLVSKARQSGPVRTTVRLLLGVAALAVVVRFVAARGISAIALTIKTFAVNTIERARELIATTVQRLRVT
jgi:hypothetical protein